MKLKLPTVLKDALYNVHESSGASDEYAKGLVVGVFAALMAATGKSYNELVPIVAATLPFGIISHRLPEAFRADLVCCAEYSNRT